MHHLKLDEIHLDAGAWGSHPEKGCVVFEGHIEANGYGKRGRVWVHREALARKLGRPIAPGMDACHTCDNPPCINGDHLYEGTRQQNMADVTARGRHNKPRGERHWRSKLTAEQVTTVRAAAASGQSHKSQARRLGVHPVTISRIVRGLWRTEVPS